MPAAHTVAELVSIASERLRRRRRRSRPRLDAELLLAQALGRGADGGSLPTRTRPSGDGARETFEASVARRARGEPVAYIRGFRSSTAWPSRPTLAALIPRPETELLVDAAIAEVAVAAGRRRRGPGAAPPLRIADVGTGTGAIAVALLSPRRAAARWPTT